ncbi:protein kinase domain-containing protein [Citrus sinensis]|uniref:non-specific serine/threonine protein kinase n=1 Tax=Citrus clementina TaxID=85681 RepID=V4T6S5_CITCL|nr:hypothetical protein CICLE_v10033530mg [Citrus x clementina]KAH9702376.1 protein kinase domain-containing protein [Citrus sinensis]
MEEILIQHRVFVRVTELARNHLVGSIPPKIGNVKSLRRFDVSRNNLSGEFPSELGLCSSIEEIYLVRNFFHRSISSSLSSLRVAQEIDLSRNNLIGRIPIFFVGISLKYLDLSFNDLGGEVPAKRIFANASAVLFISNCNSLYVILSFFIFCRFKKRRGPSKQPLRLTLRNAIPKEYYESLVKATDGFPLINLIGVGSFDAVYKGVFDLNRAVVAIKVLSIQCQGASKSFMAECKDLKNICHRNLVRVITSYSSIDFQGNEFKALVYEYMPKWNIAIDVASALDYLHHHCQELILHCDLKPSNVLLDNDFFAHIGDFELARFRQEVSNPTQSSSNGVRRTIGYTALDYDLGSEVSTNGDAYNYGILLLEMVTRRKPIDFMFEGDLNLHNFARMAFPNRVMDIVNLVLLNDNKVLAGTNSNMLRKTKMNSRLECLIFMVRIGAACSMGSSQDRMNVPNAVHDLQSVNNILLPETVFKR